MRRLIAHTRPAKGRLLPLPITLTVYSYYGVQYTLSNPERLTLSGFIVQGEYSLYGQLFFTPLAKSLKLLVHLGEVGEGAAEVASGKRTFMFGMDALFLYFFVMYGCVLRVFQILTLVCLRTLRDVH
jgi:hypothetical protein